MIILFGIHTYYGQASFTNLAQYQGLFPHGSFGFLMSFQIALYSFVGIELIGVTAGETKHPEKRFHRLSIMYLFAYYYFILVVY